MIKPDQEPLVFEFSKDQFLFIELTLVLTLFSTPILLWTTADGLLCLTVYIILFTFLIPLGYMTFLFQGKRAMEFYFTGEFSFKKNLLKWGFLISFVAFGVHFLIGWVYFDYFFSYENFNFPVDTSNDLALALFLVVFLTFYPVCEELYWRVFIAKTFPRTEFYYALNSLHYGLLHTFVLLQVTGVGVSLMMGVYFFAIGCLFIYLKRLLKLVSVMMVHLSMNLGAVMAFYIFYIK